MPARLARALPPPGARVVIAANVTGSPISWATRRCYVSLNRAVGWIGGCRRETAGTQAPGVLRERVPVLGRE